MAVAGDAVILMQPVSPSPSLIQMPYIPIARFITAKQLTGDVSGGDVIVNYRFKKATDDNDYYVVLMSFLFTTTETTAAKVIHLYPTPSEWEDLTALLQLQLYVSPLQVIAKNTTLPSEEFKVPKYLGRPTKAGQGTISADYDTNTDGKSYNYRLSGLVFAKPPLHYI